MERSSPAQPNKVNSSEAGLASSGSASAARIVEQLLETRRRVIDAGSVSDIGTAAAAEPDRDLVLEGRTGMLYERLPDGSLQAVMRTSLQTWA
jgi:hypothetical protein